MIGQGRPLDWLVSRSSWVKLTACFLLCCALAAFGNTALADSANQAVRIRAAWGGNIPQEWRTTISSDRGSVEEPRPLGIEADEPGSMWADDGRVFVRQRSPRTYDGLDLTARGPLDAKLRFEFRAAEGSAEPVTVTVSVRDLLESPIEADLDDRGSRMLVRRAPGDVNRDPSASRHGP